MGNKNLATKADEQKHVLAVEGLRVLITRDGDYWFAQGLEIDYAAAGASLEDVKDKFAEGLCLSLVENLRLYGDVKQFVKIAPEEEWNKLLRGGASQFDLSVKRIVELPSQLPETGLPFDSIHFYQPKTAASREAARG
jgi:hypothetical protein